MVAGCQGCVSAVLQAVQAGVCSSYSLHSLEVFTLLAVFRCLTSKLCSADKGVREGSSRSCHYDPVLAQEHFFVQQNPFHYPHSIPKRTSVARRLKKQRRTAESPMDQTGVSF